MRYHIRQMRIWTGTQGRPGEAANSRTHNFINSTSQSTPKKDKGRHVQHYKPSAAAGQSSWLQVAPKNIKVPKQRTCSLLDKPKSLTSFTTEFCLRYNQRLPLTNIKQDKLSCFGAGVEYLHVCIVGVHVRPREFTARDE